MEVEGVLDRNKICEKLTRKLITRPGSLELIEKGVLQADSELKHILKSGDVLFRRVSSDETDNVKSSPSHKILRHQEALDDVTARRLSLAAQQQRLLQNEDSKKMMKISENTTTNQITITNNNCTSSRNSEKSGISRNNSNSSSGKSSSGSSTNSKQLITGQVSRFKGLVFHNYCPANSIDNQEARLQQQDKLIQFQNNDASNYSDNIPSNKKPPKQMQVSNDLNQQQKQSLYVLQQSNQNQTAPNKSSTPSLPPQQRVFQNKCQLCMNNPDRISNLNDLTVAQLKVECRLRSISRAGNKQSLIESLSDYAEEILAIENSCPHLKPSNNLNNNNVRIMSNVNYTNNENVDSSKRTFRPPLNDRSISLPTDYTTPLQQTPSPNNHFNINSNTLPPTTHSYVINNPVSQSQPCHPVQYSGSTIGLHNIDNTPPHQQHITFNLSNPNSLTPYSLYIGTSSSSSASSSMNTLSNIAAANSTTTATSSPSHKCHTELGSVINEECNSNDNQQNSTNDNDNNSNHSNSATVVVNPLLFYRFPTNVVDQQEPPAFIQTSGLEMIQLVQHELLRNIEVQTQLSQLNHIATNNSSQEALSASNQNGPQLPTSINSHILQHQRDVLINFINQLIQKTPAFYSSAQLIQDQQRIESWLWHNSSNNKMDGYSNDGDRINRDQSVSSILHQESYIHQDLNPSSPHHQTQLQTNQSTQPDQPTNYMSSDHEPMDQQQSDYTTDKVDDKNAAINMTNTGVEENDLLNLIEEVVHEDQIMQDNNQNQENNDSGMIRIQCYEKFKSKPSNLPVILSTQEVKPPYSPMQIDSTYPVPLISPSSPSSCSQQSGDQKRAAWLQRVSPRLYKAAYADASSTNPNGSQVVSLTSPSCFSIFTFDNPSSTVNNSINTGNSIISSHTSSDGCGSSFNSSITDAQILSPATEKVLFQTIFQHTNSGSSTDNDIFSSTMQTNFVDETFVNNNSIINNNKIVGFNNNLNNEDLNI